MLQMEKGAIRSSSEPTERVSWPTPSLGVCPMRYCIEPESQFLSYRCHLKKPILINSLSESISYLTKTFLALDLLLIGSRNPLHINLSIKPNHEQSWDGKPRLRAY